MRDILQSIYIYRVTVLVWIATDIDNQRSVGQVRGVAGGWRDRCSGAA